MLGFVAQCIDGGLRCARKNQGGFGSESAGHQLAACCTIVQRYRSNLSCLHCTESRETRMPEAEDQIT